MSFYNKTSITGLVFGGLLLMAGCSVNPYKKTNRIYKSQVKSLNKVIAEPLLNPYSAAESEEELSKEPSEFTKSIGAIHFNLRKPNFVIIHHTAQQSTAETVRTFTAPHTEVSSHYVIGKDGLVIQMVNDYLRSWHAGAGKWGSVTDLNSVSLGIELDNNGSEPFSKQQINSLLQLLDTLKSKYNIPTANFLAHSDIAPSRKQDPSVFFPWQILAEKGFGLWPDQVLTDVPDSFNPTDALRIIGYDTRELDAAIIAFKRRYIVYDLSPIWTSEDLKVLYNLYLKW